jgi:hypothetical protein
LVRAFRRAQVCRDFLGLAAGAANLVDDRGRLLLAAAKVDQDLGARRGRFRARRQ